MIQVGNRKGTIKPADYQWTAEANPEEIYADKIIRNPMTQLEIGDLIPVAARKIEGASVDFMLEQEPLIQGALMSYRLSDGAVTAMVGGYDYAVTRSEFNRAIQAVRQPGSAFKPIIYGAAIEQGLTPATIIVDSPIVYKDVDEQTQLEKTWRPDNSTEKFYGDTTLRNALAFSRNIPSIKLLQHVKISNAINFARRLGIKSKLNEDLTLALGGSAISLEELMKAWAVFANKGQRLTPYFIRRVEDRDGNVLEEYKAPAPEPVIADSVAFLMTSLLQSVVDYGTGNVVKELGRPIAGKTGTTSDYKDAWFVGYIPQMITGVWVGFDEDRAIGRNETGTRAAAPIWLDYMKAATAKMPVEEFAAPGSVIQKLVDTETGDLPTETSRKKAMEWFIDGTAPGQPVRPVPIPGGAQVAAAPSPVPTSADGQPLMNRPLVITGNPGLGPTSRPSAPTNEEVETDEIYREEL